MSISQRLLETNEQSSANSVLTQPNLFMPALAEVVQDEMAFFCHDMNGRFTYLSKSAENVMNHDPQELLNRPFCDVVTDDPCNDHIRSCDWRRSIESSSTSYVCEMINPNGDRRKLKYWRVPVLHNGIPIGLAGIICRLRDQAFLDSNSGKTDELTESGLLASLETLTPVESEVVDMVVNGQMNKEIAAVLNVAVRTIESRRSRAMAKLNTKNLSELVQLWVRIRRIKIQRAQSGSASPPDQQN